jgi:hypothetical protein
MSVATLKVRDKAGNLSAAVQVTINWQATRSLPFVGAAMQSSTTDPSSLETFCGRRLGIHRTYWNLSTTGTTSLPASITSARADVAAGRVAWVSYKLKSVPDGSGGTRPMTWAEAVAGQADADIASVNTQLGALGGSIWVAIHHEPEGDGVLSDWVKMQQRLLPKFTAPNIRTSIVLTGYDTYRSGNPAYSVDALWPGSMAQILGIDCYNYFGSSQGGAFLELGSAYYDKIAADAKARGVDWAIAETGYTDTAAAQDADWLTRAFDDMANHPIRPGIGLTYFNSNANSVGTWPLGTGVKRDKFKAILNRSR